MTNKNTLKFILALKLQDLRKKRSLSLKELAKLSGLSVSYLNEIEKAKKYPKSEKLNQLASALDVNYNDLVSTEVNPKIKPLVEFFENNYTESLPMSEFGISEGDLFDLVSYEPKKFSSFIITMSELTRMYDIQISDINKAALRAYQEYNNNYFEDIEDRVAEFLSNFPQIKSSNITNQQIEDILINNFMYEINYEKLSQIKELESTRSVFQKGNPNKLFINDNLSKPQKLYVLCRELGSCLFNHKRPDYTGSDLSNISHEELFNDFKASYFAGALLMNKDLIFKDLSDYFQNEEFSAEKLQELMNKYPASTEVFFHRLSQIIPEFFGLTDLFFLRSNLDTQGNRFSISKEMHLSKLHSPHATRLGEEYCRRWITVTLFNRMEDDYVIDAQISDMITTGEKYLCLSIARPSRLKPSNKVCITIGLKINDKLKETIKFWNDKNITEKKVGQTCERCPEKSCSERVSENIIFEKNQEQLKRIDLIKSLLKS